MGDELQKGAKVGSILCWMKCSTFLFRHSLSFFFRLWHDYSSQVVARTGDPLVLEDWKRCAVSGAKSVVLVSPDHVTPEVADAQVREKRPGRRSWGVPKPLNG